MSAEFVQIFDNLKRSAKNNRVYCDYLAHLISNILPGADKVSDGLIGSVGKPEYDLDTFGAMISTKKFIQVTDKYGSVYRITVEEL